MSCQDGGHNQSLGETTASQTNEYGCSIEVNTGYLHCGFIRMCHLSRNQRSSGCVISLQYQKQQKPRANEPDPFLSDSNMGKDRLCFSVDPRIPQKGP